MAKETQRLISSLQTDRTEILFSVVLQCLDCRHISEDVEQLRLLTVHLSSSLINRLMDFAQSAPSVCQVCGSSQVLCSRTALQLPQTLVVLFNSVDPFTGHKIQQPCRVPRYIELSSQDGQQIHRLVLLALHSNANSPSGHWTAARLDHNNRLCLYNDSQVVPASSFADAINRAGAMLPATPGATVYELGQARPSNLPLPLGAVLPSSTTTG